MGNKLLISVVVVFAVILTVGALAPSLAPVIITTPESGSMEPTAGEQDLVIVTKTTPTVDDIALYESNAHDQLVLHRIVDTTLVDGETAFITQGDANPQTDQATGHEPLHKDQIVGTVPSVFGIDLIIPGVGGILTNPIILVGIWGLLALSMMYSTTSGKTIRGIVAKTPTVTHGVIIGLLIILVIPAVVLGMPVDAQTQITTTSTESASIDESTTMATIGDVQQQEITLQSPAMGVVHQSIHVSGEMEFVETTSTTSDSITVVVQNSPSDEPTVQRGEIQVYSYPAVLPENVIQQLAAIHPVIAAFATSTVIGGTVILTVLGVFDRGRIVRATKTTIHTSRRRLDRNHVK